MDTPVGRYPASGSPRYAVELGLPDLRCWRIKHYPYLVFYVASNIQPRRISRL